MGQSLLQLFITFGTCSIYIGRGLIIVRHRMCIKFEVYHQQIYYSIACNHAKLDADYNFIETILKLNKKKYNI